MAPPNMSFQVGPQGYGMLPPTQMQHMNPAAQGMPQQSMPMQMPQQSMPMQQQSMPMQQQNMPMQQQSMPMQHQPQQNMSMPQQNMPQQGMPQMQMNGPPHSGPMVDASAPSGRVTSVMESQGLSSWLGNEKSEGPEDKSMDRSNDSPLDISLDQLRAKETINRISPEKRSLVEEIDSEADDKEFDERAHWARRGSRKKARASRRAAEDKSQPSIALFCIKETSNDTTESGGAVDSATTASKLEKIDSEDLSLSVLEKAEIESRGELKYASSDIVSLVTPEKPSKSSDDDIPSNVMSSGRPKRQAVVRAEIMQQQQKLLAAVEARKSAASFLTPPPSAKKADANSTVSGRKRKLEMNKKKTSPNTKKAPSGNSATPGKSPNIKTAQSFFLNEEEKKQLQEIEAVSLFREQLRQTREKDKAFFTGATVNPFFQARAVSKRCNSVENDDGVIEIDADCGDDDGEIKQRRGAVGGRWKKNVRELFAGLEQAKAKHFDREQNLSLVDRYMPVNASGLVGNYDVLRLLSSWLSAWKVGGDDRDRRDCFESELFTFEDGDSDSEDEVGDLCRLFILEGESGSGKSAAVYACAEELGYEIIEINAAQNRSGKSIVELAGEATQSTRVLHVGGKDDRVKKKHKKKRRRHSEGRKSLDKGTAASLSLVLFEDVDLVFDDDKGFLSALCSIAKHSKCPIVVTCNQLPDAFPSKPGRLRRGLFRPSMGEFATWMRLVAFIEGLPVALTLVNALVEAKGRKPEDKSHEEKVADAVAMEDLAHVMDAASLADIWMAPNDGEFGSNDNEDSFFLCQRKRLAALELRHSSLYMLESPANPLGASLQRVREAQAPSASVCIQRTLDSALAASRRLAHQEALAELKPKFELPLAYKGTGLQEGRRRTSRRNHYLGDVLGDMALLDELPSFNTYLQLEEDQIVAASPASSQ
ncbi:hypothetical protein JM18_002991 [Phytophthora kernoviae]|uniref:ATPase AAA-type core domain-containing protein n=2 Tax=Phytophthora kernoviae TaxID=325452 RepID=A0A8T0M3F3_9STRA|nr:hypothetical protein G195_004338 [Phytophthora kernoviae 00238/432]KAG2527498.1 hypothetical protein JM16_003418 [Phytophthora kernoviae]KAG2528797.1 hypothetical protein JM18_002991 [Phytophthora kernoviae]